MKKVLSIILAMAMVLALAVPAFASTTTGDTTLNDVGKAATGASTNMAGETKVPIIDIVVPKNAKIIVNPYKISVTPTGGTATQDTVISPTNYITNKSDIELTVGTKITGKTGTGVNFATAAPTGSETTNDVYLNFEATPLANDAAKTALDWDSDTNKKSKVVAKTAVDLDAITLPAASSSAANYIAFHVVGEAVSAPTKPWTAAMTASVTVAFTFKPVANTVATPPAAVTATITEAASKTSIATGETASLTVALSGGKTIDSVVWSADDSGANVSLGGSTSATETVTWVAAGGSVTITATVTYDTNQTTTATFTLGTT